MNRSPSLTVIPQLVTPFMFKHFLLQDMVMLISEIVTCHKLWVHASAKMNASLIYTSNNAMHVSYSSNKTAIYHSAQPGFNNNCVRINGPWFWNREGEKRGCQLKQSHRQFNNRAPPGEGRSRAWQHSEAKAANTEWIDVLPLDRDSCE